MWTITRISLKLVVLMFFSGLALSTYIPSKSGREYFNPMYGKTYYGSYYDPYVSQYYKHYMMKDLYNNFYKNSKNHHSVGKMNSMKEVQSKNVMSQEVSKNHPGSMSMGGYSDPRDKLRYASQDYPTAPITIVNMKNHKYSQPQPQANAGPINIYNLNNHHQAPVIPANPQNINIMNIDQEVPASHTVMTDKHAQSGPNVQIMNVDQEGHTGLQGQEYVALPNGGVNNFVAHNGIDGNMLLPNGQPAEVIGHELATDGRLSSSVVQQESSDNMITVTESLTPEVVGETISTAVVTPEAVPIETNHQETITGEVLPESVHHEAQVSSPVSEPSVIVQTPVQEEMLHQVPEAIPTEVQPISEGVPTQSEIHSQVNPLPTPAGLNPVMPNGHPSGLNRPYPGFFHPNTNQGLGQNRFNHPAYNMMPNAQHPYASQYPNLMNRGGPSQNGNRVVINRLPLPASSSLETDASSQPLAPTEQASPSQVVEGNQPQGHPAYNMMQSPFSGAYPHMMNRGGPIQTGNGAISPEVQPGPGHEQGNPAYNMMPNRQAQYPFPGAYPNMLNRGGPSQNGNRVVINRLPLPASSSLETDDPNKPVVTNEQVPTNEAVEITQPQETVTVPEANSVAEVEVQPEAVTESPLELSRSLRETPNGENYGEINQENLREAIEKIRDIPE